MVQSEAGGRGPFPSCLCGTPRHIDRGRGRSAPRRQRVGGAAQWRVVVCALVGRGGRRGRGGADPVGGADGAVLDGLALRAAGDRHLLAAPVFVGDCSEEGGDKHLGGAAKGAKRDAKVRLARSQKSFSVRRDDAAYPRTFIS